MTRDSDPGKGEPGVWAGNPDPGLADPWRDVPPGNPRNAFPEPVRLDKFLELEDDPVRYRIQGLLPIGARIILAAQFKAGKSTMVANLIRALADGEAFLGAFDVTPTGRGIVLIDDELDTRTLRRWLRDQGVRNTHLVHVVSLRGQLKHFNLMDPALLDKWVEIFRRLGAGTVVLDCLRPVLDSVGLSESNEAGQFLDRFDELLYRSGMSEALLLHHMGHTNERSRGDSRLRDWPDAEWRITRQITKDDDGQAVDEPAAPRYFAAYGRDVDIPEHLLTYNQADRHLTYSGTTRAKAKAGHLLDEIITYLAGAGPQSKTMIVERVTGRAVDIRAAITEGLSCYRLVHVTAPRAPLIGVPGHLKTPTPSHPVPDSGRGHHNPVPPVYRDGVVVVDGEPARPDGNGDGDGDDDQADLFKLNPAAGIPSTNGWNR